MEFRAHTFLICCISLLLTQLGCGAGGSIGPYGVFHPRPVLQLGLDLKHPTFS